MLARLTQTHFLTLTHMHTHVVSWAGCSTGAMRPQRANTNTNTHAIDDTDDELYATPGWVQTRAQRASDVRMNNVTVSAQANCRQRLLDLNCCRCRRRHTHVRTPTHTHTHTRVTCRPSTSTSIPSETPPALGVKQPSGESKGRARTSECRRMPDGRDGGDGRFDLRMNL